MAIWLQTCVRRGAGCVRLRGCPPPFGLLLDAAVPYTPSATAVNMVGSNGLNTRHASKSWQVVLLQRSGIKEEELAQGQHGGQPRS